MIDYDHFPEQQQQARAEGRYLGLGLGCYVEGTGIGPYEGAHILIDNQGEVHVATGVSTQGQGHPTTFAQIAADILQVPLEKVHVTTGDTQRFSGGRVRMPVARWS